MDKQDLEARWQFVPTGGALDIAMADVLDNIAAVVDLKGTEPWVRQNLLALANVARRVAAQELYRIQADAAYAEIQQYEPGTIKATLRLQREAAETLVKPSKGNSSSRGTTTRKDDPPF